MPVLSIKNCLMYAASGRSDCVYTTAKSATVVLILKLAGYCFGGVVVLVSLFVHHRAHSLNVSHSVRNLGFISHQHLSFSTQSSALNPAIVMFVNLILSSPALISNQPVSSPSQLFTQNLITAIDSPKFTLRDTSSLW